jgi:acid-sensing ion channel, other
VTVCPRRRIDDVKLQIYLEKNAAMFPNETMVEKVKDFIQKLATISYNSMDTFPLDITPDIIHPDTYLDLMSDLKWEFVPEISSGTSNKLIMMRTVTENGICDAVNSKVSFYQSFEYWRKNRWDIIKPNITVVVHPFDGEIYAQLTNLSTSYDVFVHGAMEVPDISRQQHFFPETDYTTVEFLALEILTSEDAKKLVKFWVFEIL